MDVAKTREALTAARGMNSREARIDWESLALLSEATEFALEVLGEGCALWVEGVCGGRLVDGLCGTHQPTEPIPLSDPNEWIKEMQ